MKKMALSLVLLSFNAVAGITDDPGLNQLRQSFSGLIQSAPALLDKAATMKPIITPPGSAISADDCKVLATKIATNYKINPFQFVSETGSSMNGMCGGQYGFKKNFLLPQNGVSNLGLPYTMVVQLPDDTGSALYFIDSSNHIVEIERQTVSKVKMTILSYAITAIDPSGNVFISVYDQNYSRTGGLATDVSGTHTMQEYVAADGSTPFPFLRNSIKNPTDPTKNYEILRITRADQKDWQDYQLPITYADVQGGYYSYGGKYYDPASMPNFQSSLTIKYRGGNEICSSGYVKTNTAWTYLPADATSYEDCENY